MDSPVRRATKAGLLAVLLAAPTALTACKKPTTDARPATSDSAALAASAGPNATADGAAAAPKLAVSFSHDDVPAATKRATSDGKALFVDAWAPWCHTCLSMKSYVFTDAALSPLGKRLEFVAIDTDNENNGAFLEKYDVNVWPTFFVIDPTDGAVLGMWPGAASTRELVQFANESLDALDRRRKSELGDDSPLGRLVAAKAAQVAGKFSESATHYEKLLASVDATWPRRSEALLGWVMALHRAEEWKACVNVGKNHLSELRGSAIPADFCHYYVACIEKFEPGPDRKAALGGVIAHLEKLTESPPPDASVDDRADALSILANTRETLGDHAGQKAANERRLALMEKAAAEAPTPQVAQTHDYARANAYLALGKPDRAIKMLREREKQLPESYEPPARLASMLSKVGQLEEAKAAIDRALPKSYGPRRLRYLALKADILRRLRDFDGEVRAIEEEVSGYEKLAAGQANQSGLEAAKRRLRIAKTRRDRSADPG